MLYRLKDWLVLAGIVVGCACASLDVRTDFDFGVEIMPYRQTLTEGETVELRFSITPDEEGNMYDSARYRVRYFPVEGEGYLRIGQDTAMRPNDLYPLPGREIRMYYTPLWGKAENTHQLDLTFEDDRAHRHGVSVTFNTQKDEDDM